ncbi:MAG: hypothetical protein LBI28_07905 [Treponema sp.]|jgi:uncharacterized Zn finger protein (UPF0148 family)|nr:hypothetical protein [Treponema sp.]
MSKAHRGKGIREQFAHGRGVCPVCERSNVKVLYEQEAAGQKFKICKVCRASIKNGKASLPVTDAPVAEEPKAEATAAVTAEPAAAAEPAATETASAEA